MVPDDYFEILRPRRPANVKSLLRIADCTIAPMCAALVACLGLSGCAGSSIRLPSPKASAQEPRVSEARLIPGPMDTTMRLPWAKLLVMDERGRYLLVRWKSKWEVPGNELSSSAATNENSCARFLDEFGSELGIKVQSPRLAADVLQHFAGRNTPVRFRWYAVRLAGGTAKIPAGSPDTDQVAWMPLSEMLEAIPYPAARRILKQISQWPHQTIRGEYEVDYSVNPPGGSLRIIHEFAPEPLRTGPR